jgi:hypothetical protein
MAIKRGWGASPSQSPTIGGSQLIGQTLLLYFLTLKHLKRTKCNSFKNSDKHLDLSSGAKEQSSKANLTIVL